MGKIKLNLPTGSSVEKSLINSFKVDNVTYVVFDAASVGSMGLPIILVSKYENNRLIKIVEQDEWTKVKGYLKEIISGVKKDFVRLNNILDADEVYYTQLTLPVASFDSLKKSYEENLVDLVSQENLSSSNLMQDIPVQNNEVVNVENNTPINLDVSSSTNDFIAPTQGVTESVNNNLENSVISDNTNNIVDNNSDLILPSVSENNNTQVETSVITNNDVAVNPLLSDNSLPVLELPENHPTNDNLNVNVINDSLLGENVSNLVEDVTSPTAQKELDLSSEKEEFLKYCSEFFDKIIEKIKNN